MKKLDVLFFFEVCVLVVAIIFFGFATSGEPKTRQAIGKSGIVTIITEDGNIWEVDSADCRITFDTNKTEDITDDIITKIEFGF